MSAQRAPTSAFDLTGIVVEQHVRRALDVADRHAGPEGVDARALLLACVALADEVRSRAFRRIAGLLGPRAADLARKGPVPSTPAHATPSHLLVDAFQRHRDVLVASGFWGRDLVTLALLAASDPSLTRLASETGADLEEVRRGWFVFLDEAGEHRTAAEWAAWWESEGLTPPATFPPVEQKVQAQGDEGEGVSDAAAQAATVEPDVPTMKLEDFDLPLWLARLTPEARAVVGSAWGLVLTRASGQTQLGVEHLLAALTVDGGGILDPVLRRIGVTRERVFLALPDPKEDSFPPTWTPAAEEAFPWLAPDAREALLAAMVRAGAALVDVPHVAEGALSVPRSPVLARLRALGLTRTSLPWAAPIPVLQAGYRSDSASGEDRLGVQFEARTLAAVMSSTAVDPPLSIGLFGPWGSGKSFFMRLLQEEVQRLAASGSPGYCRTVVQIRFNAWHYIDGNLWASLAGEVFEQLGREVEARERAARGEEPGVQRARLLLAARQSRSAVEEAEARRAELSEELDRARTEVEALRGEHWRERTAASAPRVAREAIERLSTESAGDLRADVRQALESLGLPAGELDPETVRRALTGPARTLVAWGQALRTSSPRQWIYLGVGLAVAVLVAWRGGSWLDTLGGALGRAVSALSLLLGALPALRAWGGRVRSVLDEVRPVAERFERFAGSVRVQLEEEERARMELVLKQLDTAKQREEAARARLGAIEEELATLFKADRLSSFVQERRKSRYYQAQLGVIAQARQDFEQLSRLLRDGGDPAGATITASDLATEAEIAGLREGMPDVDRIVLYIDDLDRCPEAQVVDVLQAVHLLLAFHLFVVVVGVDPRWLIHSLADRSEVFQAAESPMESAGDGRHHWRSTPLDYLEKIFQIPFHLRPMGETGFGDLVDDITRDGSRAAAVRGHGVSAADAPTGKGARPVGGGEPGAGVDAELGGDRTPADAPLDGTPPAPPDASPDVTSGAVMGADASLGADRAPASATGGKPEDRREPEPIPVPQLSIADWEKTFMKAFYPFITSPRAAKRYVNVYRLIRAAHIVPALALLPGGELELDREREGDPDGHDAHRTVLLLLAMLTGFPEQAIALFRWIVEDGDEPDEATLGTRLAALGELVAGRAAAEQAMPEPAADEAADRSAHMLRGIPEEDWVPFLAALDRGIAELEERSISFDPPLADVREWIPFVARYAFVSGQALRS